MLTWRARQWRYALPLSQLAFRLGFSESLDQVIVDNRHVHLLTVASLCQARAPQELAAITGAKDVAFFPTATTILLDD